MGGHVICAMPAAALLCIVVAITDGDTLRVRCDDSPQAVVRLAEIDAPEKRQAYGEASRQSLVALCWQKSARVLPVTRDRYGRTVARVECEDTDASAYQVQQDMAWAFTRYLTDPAIKTLETQARQAHEGLCAAAAGKRPALKI